MRHSDGINNRTWLTAGIWVIATVAIGMVLHQGARILAPFAMAVFVWLVMEGFARAILDDAPLTGAGIEDGIASVRAMLAIARSAAEGRKVRLDEVSGQL